MKELDLHVLEIKFLPQDDHVFFDGLGGADVTELADVSCGCDMVDFDVLAGEDEKEEAFVDFVCRSG